MAQARSDFVGNCKRCGQPVGEHHSHVMLVPVGRGRMFFHAGCMAASSSNTDGDPSRADERHPVPGIEGDD